MASNQDESILIRFEEALTQAALSSSTVVNYLADLRAFLRWGQQEVRPEFSLVQADQNHIRAYRRHLVEELKRAAATVNRHLMALRKFFTFALERELVLIDPTAGISLVQDNGQTASRPLSEAEIERLLQAAQQGSRAGLVRRDVAILLLLLNTGLRVSEIVDLKKDDLIFDNPGVRLRVCDAHNDSKVRHLPVGGRLCKALSEYLAVRPQLLNREEFFLSQGGRPVSSRTVQRIIRDCARTASLAGVSAQSIRRTFAWQLLLETQDLGLVSRRLGHQNKSITEQYLSAHESKGIP